MKLTSSNTFSNGVKKMSLRDYIQYTTSQKNGGAAHIDRHKTCGDLGPSAARSNESFYLFGNNYGSLWDRMKENYLIPPCLHCDVCGARTIGIGGYLSGVSFHHHGPGFSEVIVGRKRWFLFPPHQPSTHTEYDAFGGSSKKSGAIRDIEYHKQFDPNMTVDRWLLEEYPAYRTRLVPALVPVSVTSATSEIDTADSQHHDIDHHDIKYLNALLNISDEWNSSNQSDIVDEWKSSNQSDIVDEWNSSNQSDNNSDGSKTYAHGSEERSRDTSPHGHGYNSGLLECVTGPGEMLYFPSSWMHATLNVDEYNVFMSLFLDFQLIPKS